MIADPLARFVELLERVAPEVARRMRPAPSERVAALRATPQWTLTAEYGNTLSPVPLHLPPEYLRLLEIMGGNHRGELAPFIPEMEFHVDHAIASYRQADVGWPWVMPVGSVFLCDDEDDPVFLCPTALDAAIDPLRRYRVTSGMMEKEGPFHALGEVYDSCQIAGQFARYGTLEEFLLRHLLDIRFFPQRVGHLMSPPVPPLDGGLFTRIVAYLGHLGFGPIAGASPHDWFLLVEDDDEAWVWVQRSLRRHTPKGVHDVLVAARNPVRQAEICRLIHRELYRDASPEGTT